MTMSDAEYGYTLLLNEMASRSTGHWDWDKAHLVFTGKDAGQDPWGQRALELYKMDKDTAYLCLHAYASRPCDETASNPAPKCALHYANTGMNIMGEWVGEDWGFYMWTFLSVPLQFDAAGAVDAPRVVDAMLVAATPALEAWEAWEKKHGPVPAESDFEEGCTVECYYKACPHHEAQTPSALQDSGPFCTLNRCVATGEQLEAYARLRRTELYKALR